MPFPTPISWVILAGGRATRMGGEDKGLITLNGRPLIDYVYSILRVQTLDITINANRNVKSYQKYASVIKDEFKGFPGPLGGIHTGLKHASSEWVGFVPCDSPCIPNNLVKRFQQSIEAGSDILVAHDGKNIQPVFTLFHKRVLPKLEAFLNRGDRKITLLYQECNTQKIDFSDVPNCFVNLNNPEELEQFGNLL